MEKFEEYSNTKIIKVYRPYEYKLLPIRYYVPTEK